MGCATLVVVAPALYAAQGSATTSVQFGTLSNFDVFNDTGQPTHGFEIELDGISATDVTYKFGAPYQRYGDPTVTSFSGGVDVIYASPYDTVAKSFTQTTPLAPSPIVATGGHACWTGGSANYATAGCEHFGLGLAATPTNVVYSWLVADTKNPGKLVTLGGGVSLPAPVWSATPPAPGAANPAPIVAAVVNPPDPELGMPLGDAVWVKVFVSESNSSAYLNRLVTGDKLVPNVPTQVETEWSLIQKGSGGGLPQDLTESLHMGAKNESVTRRFEFYKYTGPYDPSSHEATPVNDAAPSAGELGPLVGTQMAALNLAPGGKVPGDHSAPKAFVDLKPALKTKLATAKFTFHATDPDNKSFTFYCSLDGAIPAPCSSGKSYAKLAIKRHSFKVYATDTVRNASPAVTYSWTVTK